MAFAASPLPTGPRRAASSSDPGCIGVFDSGVGGLSILRALKVRLPEASFTYLGDSRFAPYGNRSAAELIERADRIVGHLVAGGARLIVVACNTASVLALASLRSRWPTLRFVGVEPGIKPAIALSRTGRVAVMATPATIASTRMADLVRRHANGAFVHLQACPGLAEAIERGEVGSAAVERLLEVLCEELGDARVDALALGCTHYAFIADDIRRRLGSGVRLVETAPAVAQQAATLWQQAERPGARPQSETTLLTTGSSHRLRVMLLRCPELAGTAVTEFELTARLSKPTLVPGTGIEPVRPLSRSGGF